MSEQISLTREQYLDSVHDLKARATELAEQFTMTQMTWQPGGGERWSVAECLDHVTATTFVLLDAMEPAGGHALPGPNAGFIQTAGFLSHRLVTYTEPPPRIQFPSPPKIRPRPTLNPEGILPGYLSSMDRLSALVGTTAGKDLNSVRFQLPLIPLLRITVASGLLVVAAHGRRHLWQALQVTRQPDFPQ